MRANTKFVNQVEEKISKMRTDDAISYLRGVLQVKGNSATSEKIQKIMERLRGNR